MEYTTYLSALRAEKGYVPYESSGLVHWAAVHDAGSILTEGLILSEIPTSLLWKLA